MVEKLIPEEFDQQNNVEELKLANTQSAKNNLNVLQNKLKETPGSPIMLIVQQRNNTSNQIEKNNLKNQIINQLHEYRHDGYGLGDIIMGINLTGNSNKKGLESNCGANSNYVLSINNGSELAKLIQMYLTFVGNKSVQHTDFATVRTGFDGKLERFTKQAITEYQSEQLQARSAYENRIGTIRDNRYRTIKNTKKGPNLDGIRNTVDAQGNLHGMQLGYGPTHREITFDSYKESAHFDMQTGKLGFFIEGIQRDYPFSFSFVRGDNKSNDKNLTDSHIQNIKIDDEQHGSNAKTMDQIIQTTYVINQMINQFIKTDKADKVNPFYIGIDGSIYFSTSGRDTRVITDETVNNMLINHASTAHGDHYGNTQMVVDYLNGLHTLVHPTPTPTFNNRQAKDRTVNID